MKSRVKIILSAVTAVFVLLVVYGVFGNNNNSVKTEVVYDKTALKTIDTRVFVLRDEKIINTGTSATVIPLLKDGDKVAKGDLFSIVCDNAQDASAYLEAEKIKEDIARYEQFNNKQSLSAIDIEKLDKEIDLIFANMLDSANKQNFAEYNVFADNLRNNLTNRQIAVGVQNIDLVTKISDLKLKLAELEIRELSTRKLFSEYAGYFVSTTDGNENTVDYSAVQNITAQEIEQAISGSNKVSAAQTSGKMICSFDWYLLACINNSQVNDLTIGDKKEILIGKNGEVTVNATVYAMNCLSGDKTALVFVCNEMNETYAHMRTEDAKIVLSRYTGYKINNAAIRTKDNIKGVYAVRNNVVVFRKLNLVETHENYSIAEVPANKPDDEGYKNIKLYDEIVVEGRNLYEGKIVRR